MLGLAVITWLTLAGFSCAHTPLVRIKVAESRDVAMLTETSDRFNYAYRLLASLAADLNLAPTKCDWALFPNRGEALGSCVAFERFGDEGIKLGALRNTTNDTIDLILVKERRVFGRRSRADIEDKFRRMVVDLLLQAYGSEAIHVSE